MCMAQDLPLHILSCRKIGSWAPLLGVDGGLLNRYTCVRQANRSKARGLSGVQGSGLQHPMIAKSVIVLDEVIETHTRSWSVVDAPCMEVPPWTLTLVFGAGEDVREEVREPVRTLGRSEMRGPAAEGGGLDVELNAVLGS